MPGPLPPPPPLSPHWALFLDVDGTLLELADSPGAVRVDRQLLELLCGVRQALSGAVALVSGRRLGDLDRLLGVGGWPAAGQHGTEVRDSAGRLAIHSPPPQAWSALRDELGALSARHPGVLLEEKGHTFALHYRRVPRLAPYLSRLARRAVARAGNGLRLTTGNRVIEIVPGGVHKGTAVERLLAGEPFAGRRPVFVGDDVSDEDAFRSVNRLGGLSVRVGPGRTVARHRLPDVAAVRRWMARLGADSAARTG